MLTLAVYPDYGRVLNAIRNITSKRLCRAGEVVRLVHNQTRADPDYIRSVLLLLARTGYSHQAPGGRLFWAAR